MIVINYGFPFKSSISTRNTRIKRKNTDSDFHKRLITNNGKKPFSVLFCDFRVFRVLTRLLIQPHYASRWMGQEFGGDSRKPFFLCFVSFLGRQKRNESTIIHAYFKSNPYICMEQKPVLPLSELNFSVSHPTGCFTKPKASLDSPIFNILNLKSLP